MAIKSFGATVTVNGTAIGSLKDISVTGVDVNFIDVTNQSAVGSAKRFLGGLKDFGTVELSGDFDFSDAGQTILRENQGALTASATPVVVTLSSGKVIGFDAVIGGFRMTNPLDGTVGFSCGLKVDGPIGIGARAALTTAMTGSDNDITLTSRRYGTFGNSTTITLVDPGSGTVALSVAVTGQAITVTLGYATGAITTTATALVAALAASTAASELVIAAVKSGDSGSGLVTALSSTPLAGGGA